MAACEVTAFAMAHEDVALEIQVAEEEFMEVLRCEVNLRSLPLAFLPLAFLPLAFLPLPAPLPWISKRYALRG